MKKMKIISLCKISIISAIYVILTIFWPLSYNDIQFRFSEILILLCFFNKDYGYGLVVGCFIANLSSPLGWPDWIFGTLATLISVLLIQRCKNMFIASLMPSIINGVIVGIELTIIFNTPIYINILGVFIGEFVCVSIVGVLVFSILRKNKGFMELIEAKRV